LATSDKSFVTEPDYYAKAVDFDSTKLRRQASERLGWTAAASLHVAATTRTTVLVIVLRDRDGQPIRGAGVDVVAFANTRAGDRQNLKLAGSADAPGLYSSPIRVDRPGLWN